MNFTISLSISTKTAAEILIRIVSNMSQSQLGGWGTAT